MPSSIATATAAAPIVEGGPIIKALNSIKLMDTIDKKNSATKELPQDYYRSPAAENVTPREGNSNNYNAQGSPEVAGDVRAWVSPNKSDEVASASKENSPDSSNQTLPSSKESSPVDSFNNLSNITASSDENKENEVAPLTSPIAVVGKSLVKPQKPTCQNSI